MPSSEDVNTENRKGNRPAVVTSLLLLLAWLAVGVCYIPRGGYGIDEGWYSLIGREVWRGRDLYSDIRFTQMPLAPYVYGLFAQILPARIEALRVVALLMTATGVVVLWRLAARRYGEYAAMIGLLTIITSKYFLYHSVLVRTQPLSFLCAVLALWSLSALQTGETERLRNRHAWLAGLWCGLVVLTRLSFLPFVVLAFAFVWTQRRPLLSYKFACGALALPLVVVTYYATTAGDQFFFGVYQFHGLMSQSYPVWANFRYIMPESLLSAIPWYLVAVAAMIAGVVLIRRGGYAGANRRAFEALVLITFIVTFALHVWRRPSFPVHHIPLAFAPVLLCAWMVYRFPPKRFMQHALIVLACVLPNVAMWPFIEGSLINSHNHLPAGIYDMSEPMRRQPGKRLLTFETGLAFCAPRVILLPGYEMGEFAINPYLPAAQQELFKGVSLRKFRADLSRADILALRPRDFEELGITIEETTEIAAQFDLVTTIPKYGQFAEPISFWQRK